MTPLEFSAAHRLALDHPAFERDCITFQVVQHPCSVFDTEKNHNLCLSIMGKTHCDSDLKLSMLMEIFWRFLVGWVWGFFWCGFVFFFSEIITSHYFFLMQFTLYFLMFLSRALFRRGLIVTDSLMCPSEILNQVCSSDFFIIKKGM